MFNSKGIVRNRQRRGGAIWFKVSQGRLGGDNVYTCDLHRARAAAERADDARALAVCYSLINTEC